MNRSFISVIAGGFGSDGSSTGDAEEMSEYRETTAEEVAEQLKNSTSVIITPGYGMAVAQAQYPVAEITETAGARREGALRHSPGRGASAGPHERAAGGGEGAVRRGAGDG